MIELDQGEIATILAGALVPSGSDARVSVRSLSADPAAVVPGDVFFALPGAVDATAAAHEAIAHGAVLVVADHDLGLRAPQVIVPDVAEALSELVYAVAERLVDAGRGSVSGDHWRVEVLPSPRGLVVINDGFTGLDSMADALKLLAQVTRGGGRSVAVLDEIVGAENPDEAHDRIGRLVVRLNVQKLVVVGHLARHIHNAAGLEGSWDGESVLVGDADEAYDLLRDELREGDVVLVKSSGSAGLLHLGERIAE